MSINVQQSIAWLRREFTLTAADDIRIVRLAFGLTLSIALAMGIGWTLSFITPVLVSKLLANRSPCPTLRQGLGVLLMISAGTVMGLLVTLITVQYPLLMVIAVGLGIFLLYYANTGGASPFLITFSLIGITLFPMMGIQSTALAIAIAWGLIYAAVVAVLVTWLAFGLFPDKTNQHPIAGNTVAVTQQPEMKPSQDERLRSATTSLLIVMPVVILFMLTDLVSWVLAMIMIVILAMEVDFAKNVKGAIALIAGNALGGLIAVLFYEGLVIVPTLVFLIALGLLVSLYISQKIFSDNALHAALFGMALTTFLLLIGSTTANPFGAEVDIKFYQRLFQIVAATLYVVLAAYLLENLFSNKSKDNKDKSIEDHTTIVDI